MDARDTYASGDWLKAPDLNGRAFTLTITDVTQETLPDGKAQLVLAIKGTAKRLGLNKTNALSIIDALGTSETDNWRGQRIEAYPTETEFQGQRMPCIRLRKAGHVQEPPQPKPSAPVQAPQEMFPQASAPSADEIPF